MGRRTKAESADYPIAETKQYGRYPQLENDSANSIMKVILEQGILTPNAFMKLHKYIVKLEDGQSGKH